MALESGEAKNHCCVLSSLLVQLLFIESVLFKCWLIVRWMRCQAVESFMNVRSSPSVFQSAKLLMNGITNSTRIGCFIWNSTQTIERIANGLLDICKVKYWRSGFMRMAWQFVADLINSVILPKRTNQDIILLDSILADDCCDSFQEAGQREIDAQRFVLFFSVLRCFWWWDLLLAIRTL